MKTLMLLVVIGWCVVMAATKPAEDACAAMRARLLPLLGPMPAPAAGASRRCGGADADLLSCVQRAFGSTAHMARADVEQRIHCFLNIVTDAGGEQRHMTDDEQTRQLGLSPGAASDDFVRSARLARLDCESQSQLGQILRTIADGQTQAAYSALKNWYISTLSQPNHPLISSNLQDTLFGKSTKSLVYLLTEFVRRTNNTLTSPVEDALISSVLQCSKGNFGVAKFVIQVRLIGGVLNPVTQDELRWIVDAFSAGSTEDAVGRIISLLAGCTAADAQSEESFLVQLLDVYDLLIEIDNYDQRGLQSDSVKNLFYSIYNRTVATQPSSPDDDAESVLSMLGYYLDEEEDMQLIMAVFTMILIQPCGLEASQDISVIIREIHLGNENSVKYHFDELIAKYESYPTFAEALNYIKLAKAAYNNSDIDAAFDEIKKLMRMCVAKLEVSQK